MAQTPATRRSEDCSIDHTPVSAKTAGDVVVIGTNLIGIATDDIAASTLGSLAVEGIFNVPKDSSNVTAGLPLYWDDNGDPVGGTAGSGAFSSNSALGPFAGFALEAAGTGVGDVDMVLRSVDSSTVGNFTAIPSATVAAAGSTQSDATLITTGFTRATGADATKGIKLPAAVAGAVVIVKNNTAAVLKVWPNTSDQINAISVDAALSMASLTSAVFVAYDATTWFTIPLLPS
jgi:predicted RecA/RadA family phage recombinase